MGKVVISAVLPTNTKMFCGCKIEYDMDGYRLDNEINTCPVCRKEKGAFGILNKKVVDEAIAVVLALNGKINQYTLFDRVKNEEGLYNTISQYSYPIGKDGYIEWDEMDSENMAEAEQNEPAARITITAMRMKESEEEPGIPMIEIVSGDIAEEQNPYYIEEIEKILLALGIEEWEIIETDDVIETMESQTPISYLPDPDIPPVIISQWWVDQIAAKYPDLIHIEEPEVEDEDDF